MFRLKDNNAGVWLKASFVKDKQGQAVQKETRKGKQSVPTECARCREEDPCQSPRQATFVSNGQWFVPSVEYQEMSESSGINQKDSADASVCADDARTLSQCRTEHQQHKSSGCKLKPNGSRQFRHWIIWMDKRAECELRELMTSLSLSKLLALNIAEEKMMVYVYTKQKITAVSLRRKLEEEVFVHDMKACKSNTNGSFEELDQMEQKIKAGFEHCRIGFKAPAENAANEKAIKRRKYMDMHKRNIPLETMYEQHPEDIHDINLTAKFRGTPRTVEPRVLYIHGTTGIGKTTGVLKACEMAGLRVYCKTKDEYWQQYSGQEVILFDEMTCQATLTEWLSWMSPTPMQVKVKYGQAWLNSPFFIITNNVPRERQFYKKFHAKDKTGKEIELTDEERSDLEEHHRAFKRRIEYAWEPEQYQFSSTRHDPLYMTSSSKEDELDFGHVSPSVQSKPQPH